MLNTELVKVLEKAVSIGNTIPDGTNRDMVEKMTRQYAATTNVSYTEEELQEVLDYAIALAKGNVTSYDELKAERF